MILSHLEKLAYCPLLHNFQIFYREIGHQKALLENPHTPSDHHTQGDRQGTGRYGAKAIQTALKEVLHNLWPRKEIPHYLEIQYIMVALADEIFLQSSCQEEWRQSLLEEQIFQSQIAGELIFRRIDALLSAQDMNRYELAQIYLMAISLGLKGQYSHDDTLLYHYQQQLYQLICHEPVTLFTQQRPLMPQCYEFTRIGTFSKGLTDFRSWIKYAVVFIMFYIGITHVLWRLLFAAIEKDMHHILNMTTHLCGEESIMTASKDPA